MPSVFMMSNGIILFDRQTACIFIQNYCLCRSNKLYKHKTQFDKKTPPPLFLSNLTKFLLQQNSIYNNFLPASLVSFPTILSPKQSFYNNDNSSPKFSALISVQEYFCLPYTKHYQIFKRHSFNHFSIGYLPGDNF